MRKSLSMAAVAVLATSLTACSATGGRKAEEQASMNAGKATTPRMTVALITHSGPGDKLKSGGAKKVLCVIHEQGNVGHTDRCAGVKSKFAQTENFYVNGKDMPSVQSAITSKLQQDKTIDSVLALGGPYAMTATKSVKESGSKAKVFTFDTSSEVIGAIKNGSVQWAVDQQPYLQGYLAVDSLWLRKNNGNIVGGGQPVLTGPAFIDKNNVADVEKYAKSGRR